LTSPHDGPSLTSLSPLTYSLSLSLSTGFVGLGPSDLLLDGGMALLTPPPVFHSAPICIGDFPLLLTHGGYIPPLLHNTPSLCVGPGPLSPLTCPLILLDSFSTGFVFLDLDLFDSLLGGGVAVFFCYSGDLDHLTFYIYEASRAKACCGRPTLGAPLS